MARTTHRRPAGRLLRFVCINDENVYEIRDGGRTKDGLPTTSRGQIVDMLKKKVEVGANRLAAFMLLEAPAPLYAQDDFDDQVLKDRSGRWYLASHDENWSAVRDVKIKEAVERKARARAKLDNLVQANVVKGLAKLAASEGAAQSAPPPAAAPVPPAVKKGGAA
jgi:hypothetical protein